MVLFGGGGGDGVVMLLGSGWGWIGVSEWWFVS